MAPLGFFLGIQDEKSSQAGEDDPNIKFPISAPPYEIEVTLGWMPHQAHECVDDRGQGKDQRADKDSRPLELESGENHTKRAQRAGNPRQGGEGRARNREFWKGPSDPKH